MPHITESTEAELKKELKRRQKAPLWQRQPLWWKLFDWISDYCAVWSLILISPIWFPFWFAYKIHKGNEKIRQEFKDKV